MKKEMSSFDVRAVVTEMAVLENGHMDKIFHWGAGNVLFRINIQGQGKKELFLKDKRWLYMPEARPETPDRPSSFASFLRKYITNARVNKVYQVGFDRIVVMELSKSDGNYTLVFELFSGGNVLLIQDGKIVNCLIHRNWKGRSIRPGEDYSMEKPRFDPTASGYGEFSEMFRSSKADTVRSLATAINLGGQYAEEICLRCGVDKNSAPSDIPDEKLREMYAEMEGFVRAVRDRPEPMVFRSGDVIVDAAPVPLTIYGEGSSESAETMSKALAVFLDSIAEDEEKAYVDPEITKLQRRIDRQTETVEEYRMEAEDLKKRADTIYEDYSRVNDLLTVLAEQSKKLTWDKLQEGAMKIPFVTDIVPSKNKVTGTFCDLRITLDYTKGIDANASDIYRQSKELMDRAKRAEDALAESREQLSKRQKGLDRAKAEALTKAQPTKQFWFERYKWFVSSTDRLVIAGRDAHTNDQIVKKHLKEEDLYAHADVHGAPSVIVKDGKGADDTDKRQACLFALAQSKAWVSALAEGSAFWAYPDQVSKTPQAGEFVPRGAFIIRGKRNYEHHLPLELAVGEMTYQNSRKVMCGPLDAVERLCRRYFVIRPGRGKGGRRANEIAKDLAVPEEEVSRILPPGDVEIVRRVWSSEDDE
ncbi:MAG: fibronectin-binding domain-containing protein [Thermoplasmatales archaeon]|nr:fibronectin-binding domain-containing protein [Thermoplasmatales archaeon]